MGTWFYEWEDRNDKNSTGVPDLARYPEFRTKTKKAVRKEWREYLETYPELEEKAHIRVWRISYEEVNI